MSTMFGEPLEINIPIGYQNDERIISKELRKETYRKLTSVRIDGNLLTLFFSEYYPYSQRKRVLQISKKKHNSVFERIKTVLDNEDKRNFMIRDYKTWSILDIIELKDKWLVFFV